MTITEKDLAELMALHEAKCVVCGRNTGVIFCHDGDGHFREYGKQSHVTPICKVCQHGLAVHNDYEETDNGNLRTQLATAIAERDAARAALTDVASANVFYAAAICKVTKELEFGDWPAAHWASRMRVHNLVAELRRALAPDTDSEGRDAT